MDTGALIEELRDYETVIDTMHCGLVAEDAAGILMFVNRRMLSWLGYEDHEVVGKHVSVLVPHELRDLLQEDLAAAGEGDVRARLMVIRRKDTTTFPVVTIPHRFKASGGEFEGFFSIVVDLGTVLTARQLGPTYAGDVRATLSRIAIELQTITLAAPTAASLPAHPELDKLSPREAEVLSILVAGERAPAIATRLFISPHTVRNHLKSMYRKLGVGTQAALIERVRELMTDPEA